ncbi:unnamed protein product [Colias eurytheme]|nr:unnamed protein product [Colias eurytheme]
MDLHLHLSAAFRALDYKWGTPVDLDTNTDLRTCLPAEIDLPTTTFSSEEYLRKIRRAKESYRPKDSCNIMKSKRSVHWNLECDRYYKEYNTVNVTEKVLNDVDRSETICLNLSKSSWCKRQCRKVKKVLKKIKHNLSRF